MSEIILEHIQKQYDGKPVLNDLSLTIRSCERVSVIGGSGSGKTTMLKLINGLIVPDRGRVYIDQEDIQTKDMNKLRQSIGYVIQSIGLFPHMNIYDNISYVLRLRGYEFDIIRQRVHELVKIVHLDAAMLKRFPDELSGGQKQRVGIARALASDPGVVLMDEAFGAVDEITRHSLQEELLRIHSEAPFTMLFVTHDIREALYLGERVIVMRDGGIDQFDTPQQIKEAPATPFVRQLLSYL